MHRRILWLATLGWIFSAALIGRLFVLMCGNPSQGMSQAVRWAQSVTVRADLQRMLLLETDDGRGRILFRNGYPWSGIWRQVTFGPQPAGLRVGVHEERQQPATAMPVVGQVGLPDKWPDSHKPVAEQGRSGLEYTFDTALSGRRPGYVGMLKDVLGRPQLGMPFRIDARPGMSVRTTVDPLWQERADTALQQAHVRRGAVVVLDVRSNEVLALASRDGQAGKRDLAVQADVPGSIFKLVTATAAFDSYQFAPDDHFHCTGTVRLPGVNMHCWTVHHRETLLQAIAQSCDVAFANIGVSLERLGLAEAARRLQVDSPQLQMVDGHPVLPDASAGVVFRHAGNDAGLLANTAIGQEDVRLTPVQAANLARTIANDGWMQDVKLVRQAEQGHRVVLKYDVGRGHQAMSRSTADKLRQGMELAVTMPTGTAHALFRPGFRLAAKTGTAELPNGQRNGWLVAFAPADHPQIAFCVFAGHGAEAEVHDAVRQVSMQLLRTYRQIHAHPVIS